MMFLGGFGIRRPRLNSNARIASTAPFACGAVLSWAESTQRPPLSWKKAPKEPRDSGSGVIPLTQPYQRIRLAGIKRRRLKSEDRINSRRNRSGGSWVKVFLFFSLGFSFLFASFLFSFLPKRNEKEEKRHSRFASISLVFIRRVVLPLSISSSFI